MTSKRTRAGSWNSFERRFRPIIRDDGSLLWGRSEMPPTRLIDWREWWTVIDSDGRLYLAAGYHFVNRLGYLRCEVPWTDADQFRDYRYD